MTLLEFKAELDVYFDNDIPIICDKILNIRDRKTQIEALTNLRKEAVNLLGSFLSWGNRRDIIDYFTDECAFEEKEYILSASKLYSRRILDLDNSIAKLEKDYKIINRYIGDNKSTLTSGTTKVADIQKDFLNLFKVSSTGEKVIEILKRYEYIDSNQYWCGQDGRRNTQLLDVITTLDELNHLKKYRSYTKVATIFYNRFGLQVGKGKGGDITDRALRIKNKNNDIDVFINLFKSELPTII
jgi:hypothetical protein